MTRNELYESAENVGFGDTVLKAKDEARYQVRNLVRNLYGLDIEERECPEDEVDEFSDSMGIVFDERGNITEYFGMKASNYTIEYCPWCESEVVIFATGVTACPKCGKPLAPCSVCDTCDYETCPYGCDGSERDEYKKITNRSITKAEQKLYAIL